MTLTRGTQTSRITWSSAANSQDTSTGPELASFAGTVTFGSGEVAAFAGVEVVDLGRPDEPFSGTASILCADGSVSRQEFSGWLEGREEAVSYGSGHWSFLSGSGRFAGLTGSGGMRWTIEDETWRAEFFPDPITSG